MNRVLVCIINLLITCKPSFASYQNQTTPRSGIPAEFADWKSPTLRITLLRAQQIAKEIDSPRPIHYQQVIATQRQRLAEQRKSLKQARAKLVYMPKSLGH